jgi:hypothetical protein
LAGTAVYGTPYDNKNPWSIKFDHIPFNQYMFVTGDKQHWVVMNVDQFVESDAV